MEIYGFVVESYRYLKNDLHLLCEYSFTRGIINLLIIKI